MGTLLHVSFDKRLLDPGLGLKPVVFYAENHVFHGYKSNKGIQFMFDARADRSNPDSYYSIIAGRADLAKSVFYLKPRSLDEAIATTLFAIGSDCEDKKNYEGALFFSTEAAKKDSLLVNNLRLIGLSNLCLKKISSAILAYDKILSADSLDARTFYLRGRLYRNDLKNLPLAAKDFERVLELNSNYFEAYEQLGKTYVDIGEPLKAQKVIDRMEELGRVWTMTEIINLTKYMRESAK